MRKEASRSSVALAAAMVVATLASRGLPGAGAAELDGFLAAHRKAAEHASAKQWTAAAKVYGAFAAAHPRDAGASLASFLQGLTLLRELDQAAPAREAFARAAGGTPTTALGRAVAQGGRAWLARLQMVQLDAALRKYWVDVVEYPASLDGVVMRKLVAPEAIVDPWGKPFAYETGRLKLAPDMPRQKYTLRCTAIEGTSRDLKKFLVATRGFGQGFKVRGIVAGPPRGANVVTPDGRSANVAEASKLGTATVVTIGLQAVVIADSDNVAVLTR
ncbi:MAG: hypothetical protein ISS72_01445 [Candidatus Brocadiae bacterium]|nr:hypothetical protein [Candidatus Brocadiia bacterium]